AQAGGFSLSDRFQIKFGFYDNFAFNAENIGAGDGYAIDDVSLTCVPKGLVATQLVDNPNPQPGESVNFQIKVTNNETVTATNSVINFIMATGLQLNGEVVIDGITAVSGQLGSTPPLLASGIEIGPGQEIIITVPTIVSEDLAPGTVLENIIIVSSNEFGSPPPFSQSIIVEFSNYATFVPFLTH
ncbi:MAG: DUF11 domain-containing protein, partial [Anaerolineales bacterium]|nr:DUF11 domain-containing protein [Anaerolineales bacterium]